MHEGLQDWDDEVLNKPRKRLRQAQHELERVMRGPMNDVND
jgi:hypothetical protein